MTFDEFKKICIAGSYVVMKGEILTTGIFGMPVPSYEFKYTIFKIKDYKFDHTEFKVKLIPVYADIQEETMYTMDLYSIIKTDPNCIICELKEQAEQFLFAHTK